ncbi:MAG: hypothetical protein AVDCRST_MAG33-2019 [uncultured Thermomicrobiales bacterium]|uniref:Uncharacterized protein n=1 Tax=uncultured Thermomicrobiales bacterium TaxID=1645740 RepID=A0A6J4V0V0_9BACT|nr:MAG: hypothetical protein AVDCRST_MAG33-2019 [uncultured Thermomicrobiales bacterium]
MDALGDFLSSIDAPVWWLIGLALATILTLQAVETAVEGAWPHQRRLGRTSMSARSGQGAWAVVALLLLIALLLAILSLSVVAWRDLELGTSQIVGAGLVGVAWVLFLLSTTDRIAPGRYLRGLGAAGPVAIGILLLAGGVLLLVTFLDILPPLEEVRDALPI